MVAATEIPREHLHAMIELRDRIRSGEIALAPQLKYYLEKYGFFHSGAFRRLLDLGRRSFALRSDEDMEHLRQEIDALPTVPIKNEQFGATVKAWIAHVLEAESRTRLWERLNAFASFMAEFDFNPDPLLREVLGVRIFVEWKEQHKRPSKTKVTKKQA